MNLYLGLISKVTWVIVSFISFLYIFYIFGLVDNIYYSTFVSSTPKKWISCGLFFFVISVGTSVLTYYRFFFDDGPISILINITSAFLFCFCILSFITCYGTKMFFDKADIQIYQNSIYSCNVDSIICDQFKQILGDISMTKQELKKLATDFVYERTLKASSSSLIIMTLWIITHSIYLNYLFNEKEEENVEESKKYDKNQIDDKNQLDENFVEVSNE